MTKLHPHQNYEYTTDYESFVAEFDALCAGLPYDNDDVDAWIAHQGLEVFTFEDQKCVRIKK